MSDLISRQAAIDIERRETVDTNPEHFESHQKFVEFMNDAEISSFGRWQWSNGFNTALTAVGIDLKRLPSSQPEPHWIPCNETIDIPENEVLCCDRYGNEMIGYLAYTDEQWLCESDAEMMYDTVAWMEKPKPWKGDAKCTNAR